MRMRLDPETVPKFCSCSCQHGADPPAPPPRSHVRLAHRALLWEKGSTTQALWEETRASLQGLPRTPGKPTFVKATPRSPRAPKSLTHRQHPPTWAPACISFRAASCPCRA